MSAGTDSQSSVQHAADEEIFASGAATGGAASEAHEHPTTLGSTKLGRMRSGSSTVGVLDPKGTAELTRRLTQSSLVSERQRRLSQADLEKNEKDLPPTFDPFEENGRFSLELYLKELLKRGDESGQEQRTMGIAFKDLTVSGNGAGADLNMTVGSVLTSPLRIVPGIQGLLHPPVKHILRDGFQGSIKPGEMLLVLGRPGSGCSTLLKTLASYRDGFRSIGGEISYQGFTHKDIDSWLRGDVTYAPEDDVHFPTLNVRQTFNFAASTRTPGRQQRVTFTDDNTRLDYRDQVREALATILGLRHTYKTLVGNELIRGISGGEKKRVSIGEILSTRAKVMLFDNSSRGLDSSTALEFGQALREFTDLLQLTTVATLYQAGEALVDCFDKVTVLYAGHQIYFGPLEGAVDYFHRLGFERHFGQSTADYLVSVTDVHARLFREGFEHKAPKSPDEFVAAWKASPEGRACAEEVDAHLAEMKATRTPESTSSYRNIVKQEQASHGVADQVRVAIKRRFQVWIGDLPTQIIMGCASLFQALIIGSAYYQMPKTTAGYFSRGGVLFFSLLFNSFICLVEVQLGYAQRPIVIRQKRFDMLSPWTDALANTLLGVPMAFFNILPFCIAMYFLTGLWYSADNFFIFFSTVWLTTLVITAFFRFLSAVFRSESTAIMFAGLGVIDFALYAGYVLPRPSMVVWWRWLSYCNPLSFAFEIVMTNEFRKLKNIPCAVLVPSGPGFETANPANQVCAIAGSAPGVTVSDGAAYLDQDYGYRFSNAPRNVGILFAFWFGLTALYALASQFQKDPTAKGDRIIFGRNTPSAKLVEKGAIKSADLEAGDNKDGEALQEQAASEKAKAAEAVKKLTSSGDAFTFRNVTFDVDVKGEHRRLLQNVTGFVAPGALTALMGESGAGKTTLLNVLAQRVGRGVGVIGGEFYISGRPLPPNFKTDTAYCLQQDVHMATTTVREALHFSAILRQPNKYTKEEKLAYCEDIIDLLEMRPFADAIVGEPGAGLNVEQRKRLTIAVELAARPSLLLFLDEPTSGLDAQAAWGIVRLLRKLADAGQAILCTIHAPSGELFAQFDRLLLLRKGGNVAYQGPLGDNCSKVLEYFSSRSGQVCGENQNVAEFMLECIGAGATATTDLDWNQLWRDSDQARDVQETVDRYETEGRTNQAAAHADSPQAKDAPAHPASFMTQLQVVLKRVFQNYWRNSDYIIAKFALNALAGSFIGSSFFGQGEKDNIAALQAKLFAIFLGLVISVSLAQQHQPVFISLRNLWEARENVCYSWPALVISLLVVEVPFQIVGASLYFIPWYEFVQFPSGKQAGYAWGMYMLFSLYWQTFSSVISAISANPQLAQVLFSTAFSFVIVFCGVVQPPPLMPSFWKVWMVPLSPFTYLLEGLLGNALLGRPVRCAPKELNTLIPPAGQSCAQYLANFSSALDSPNPTGQGYFVQNDDGSCGFCQYRNGEDYFINLSTAQLTFTSAHRFRNIGILAAYVVFNVLATLALFWLVRVAVFKRPSKKSKASRPAVADKAEDGVTAATGSGAKEQTDAQLAKNQAA